MRLNNNEYINQINLISKLNYNWNKLNNKTILITGITGMIGTVIADVIMYKNINDNLHCTIIGISRKKENIEKRFFDYLKSPFFKYYIGDVTDSNFILNIEDSINYIFHGASNTHPLAYSNDPVGTIFTNVEGMHNLYELAVQKHIDKFMCSSSVEVYGENKGDVEKADEKYMGYIDCSTLRAGYPESKRLCETICYAYNKQYNIDFNIVRFSRVYGPTMIMSDSKASSQFIKKALNKENIVLKSKGTQFYSYLCVFDAVSAFFKVLIDGVSTETYNITSDNSDITLYELANLCAKWANTKVIFDIPDENEAKGYSKATKAIIDNTKLKHIGWKSKYDIENGIYITLNILNNIICR